MTLLHTRPGTLLALLLITATFSAKNSHATIVEFQTVIGTFEVNLYDNATPATVSNFLGYVNNGAYTDSIIHRAPIPAGFVVQGGGFTFNLVWPPTAIAENPAVVNEPEFSNVRGTIAMAKLGNDPNSATSQWFINLGDNSANLDIQNGGFTVFGEVTSGMDVVDAIDALQRFNLGGAFTDLPLLSDNGGNPDANNLIIINQIVVTDTTVDTAAGLNPPANTLINPPPPPPPVAPSGGGGGGGSIGAFALLVLLTLIRISGILRPDIAAPIRRRKILKLKRERSDQDFLGRS